MLYTPEQTAALPDHTFAYLLVEQRGYVLNVTLNRPEKKNALHPVMVDELAYALSYARHESSVWVVVLRARGDVFCAGADLMAFRGAADERASTVPEPAGEVLLGELFRELYRPCIACVEGDVFAGGFLLLTGCTQVVAADDVRLSLPEVRRGLFPFQVMAGLLDVMPARKVIDWCLRGYDLPPQQACEYGLITQLTERGEVEKKADQLTQELLAGSPAAIRRGLEAYHRLRGNRTAEDYRYLYDRLMETLQTRDAQEGIAAFREKRPPVWRNA